MAPDTILADGNRKGKHTVAANKLQSRWESSN